MEEWQNQTDSRIKINIPTAIFIIIQVVFIIFLAISIPRLFQPSEINDEDPSRVPVAKINNFSSIIPENYTGYLQGIETTLFALILRNSPDMDISTSVDAVIRDNSVKNIYFKDQNINYISAIIDIPEIRQSYWFYNEYSDEEPNQYVDYYKSYRIFCLDNTQEIIYQDFSCKDDFGLAGKYELVSDFISRFEFNHFGVRYSLEDNSNRIEITPYTFDVLEDSTKESYIQQVKDAISSLGVSPELFSYYVLPANSVRYYYPLERP